MQLCKFELPVGASVRTHGLASPFRAMLGRRCASKLLGFLPLMLLSVLVCLFLLATLAPSSETVLQNDSSTLLRTTSATADNSNRTDFEPAGKIVNEHPFKFILLEEDICTKKRPDLFLIAIVHTAPKNYRKRMVIRATWGSQQFYNQVKTVVVFAMGSIEDKNVMMSVQMESERYKDIIQEDFIDSYKNLTYKGIMWLKWVSLYCPQATYVLKVDDDIFVNIFNLVTHVSHLYKRGLADKRSIMCLLWTRMPVLRDKKSKWFISEDEYAGQFFSTYCSGSAYVISQDLIYPMYQMSFRTRFFWVDDFYVTGLLPKTLDPQYTSLSSLYVLKQPEMKDRLVDGYAIFGHIPGSMNKRYELWKQVLESRGIS